jgi:hypothetical protein
MESSKREVTSKVSGVFLCNILCDQSLDPLSNLLKLYEKKGIRGGPNTFANPTDRRAMSVTCKGDGSAGGASSAFLDVVVVVATAVGGK